MMLSGFFGLIAIETSAGLIAEGSVIRTTCCAEVNEPKQQMMAIMVHFFIQDFKISKLTRFATLSRKFPNHVKSCNSRKTFATSLTHYAMFRRSVSLIVPSAPDTSGCVSRRKNEEASVCAAIRASHRHFNHHSR